MTAAALMGVLVRPVISEKSTLETDRNNYTFMVARDANKLQVKAAIEELFKVDVVTINVSITKPKEKSRNRRRSRIVGWSSAWKKAVVTLAAGQKIEFFEGV
jgi:large subunit ribosomal protein L23